MSELGLLTVEKIEQSGPSAADEFIYVDIGSIDNQSKRVVDPKRVPVAEASSRAKQRLRAGDVLVSMTRPNLNAVALISDDLDGAIGSTGFHVLRSKGDVLPEWIYYGVQTRRFIEEMSKVVQGALYPAVRPKDVRAFDLPVPGIDEQRRIVAEIEKQFSRLDEAVANLQRVKANLKRYKASILKAAVEGRLVETEASIARREGRSYETGEQLLQRILEERQAEWSGQRKYKTPIQPKIDALTEQPEGWTWASPAQLSRAEPYSLAIGPFGSSLKVSDYTTEGVPLIFVRNIRMAFFGGEKTVYVSFDKAAELVSHVVESGDILITKMGDPPGDVCQYPFNQKPAIITADCIKLRLARQGVDSAFIEYAIASRVVQDQIMGITKGVAQLKVNLVNFSSIALPLPSYQEQIRIVSEVNQHMSIVREIEVDVGKNLQRAQVFRCSFLNKFYAAGSCGLSD